MAGALSQGFNKAEKVMVARADLETLFSPFAENDETLAEQIGQSIELLEYGFRLETEKGDLYHALHYGLSQIAQSVEQAGDIAEIELVLNHLELASASYDQFNEAALQMAGARPENRNFVLDYTIPNEGEGHAEAGKKSKAENMREAVSNFKSFFEKYGIGEATNEMLDFYNPEAPVQKLN